MTVQKVEVRKRCGHREVVEYTGWGNPLRNERWLERQHNQDCAACRRAAAEKFDAAHGLPELVGSPKQIAWASSIRQSALRTLPDDKKHLVNKHTKAAWWIDHRFGPTAMPRTGAQWLEVLED